MSLNVAILMDPMESVNIDGDSTFVLALEAQSRGHRLVHFLPRDMSLRHNRPVARVSPLTVRRERGNHFSFGTPETVDLGSFDVILMRQDPPFDMAYITATHFLDHIHPKTLVVNDPTEVRNAPEKLLVTQFGELMPPTLITSRPDEIAAFRAEHKDIIVKPLFGNGGSGVFHVTPDDENLNSLLEMFGQFGREPVIVQRYLPEVRAGDKRIILIDGEVGGAVSRVPAAGEARANLHVGGKAVQAGLTSRERDICAAIGPALKQRGLLFTGIDVIGDYLTEINVTSPTGIQEINRLDGAEGADRLEFRIWDAIEAKRAATPRS